MYKILALYKYHDLCVAHRHAWPLWPDCGGVTSQCDLMPHRPISPDHCCNYWLHVLPQGQPAWIKEANSFVHLHSLQIKISKWPLCDVPRWVSLFFRWHSRSHTDGFALSEGFFFFNIHSLFEGLFWRWHKKGLPVEWACAAPCWTWVYSIVMKGQRLSLITF